MERNVLRILGRKGRTTIPYALRKKLGLKPGDIVSFTLENGCITVRREDLCDYENCPAMMDCDAEITPDTVMEDFSCLSSHDQYQVMSSLMAGWAKKLEE